MFLSIQCIIVCYLVCQCFLQCFCFYSFLSTNDEHGNISAVVVVVNDEVHDVSLNFFEVSSHAWWWR